MTFEPLEHTKIWRSGVTSKTYNFESSLCYVTVREEDKSTSLSFTLRSKGGGETAVRVSIGLQDLPAILNAIAKEIPESAVALSSASAIASEKILEQLNNLHLVLREKT
jgi:hypothetical protein